MNDERLRNEVSQLMRLATILEGDTHLPLRLDIRRLGLDFRKFRVAVRGLSSLAISGDSHRLERDFTLQIEVPTGYPWTAIPTIWFTDPIPFHPHVYTSGAICWGSGNDPNADLMLVDWIRGAIEYLQYNQDPVSMFRLNPNSPANRSALTWWQSHSRDLARTIPIIDLARLRFWIEQTRG